MKIPMPNECSGQLDMVCEQCNGARVVTSTDTPSEVCDWCDGTGIDPDAVPPVTARMIDEAARILVRKGDGSH